MASGSIRKRKGVKGTTYQVVIELGTVAGKRRQKTATYKRRKDAEEYLIKSLHELNSGAYIEPSTMPLGEYAPHWFDTIDVAPSTMVLYRGNYQRHIEPVFGEVALGKLTTADIQVWFNGLRKRYRSAPTYLVLLTAILNQAVREQRIAHNPCAAVARVSRDPQPEAAKHSSWSAEQLASFLAETRGQADWPAWWVAAHTGVRPGELVALRWGDVDFEQRTIHIRRTQSMVTATGQRVISDRPKTPSSDRVITIDPETTLVLRGVRAEQAERQRLLGPRWQNDDLVFDGGDGRMLDAPIFSARFGRMTVRLGYPHLTLHGLRHLHGSLLAMAGRPLHYIQQRLGHATLATTSRYYLHLIPGSEYADSDTFAAVLKAAKTVSS